MFRRLVQFIAYRTTKRYNVIKIKTLTPNYWDKDTILLHAMMQLVVDFVEIECAFMEMDSPYTWKQWLYLRLPWFLRGDGWIRSRELGLRHLDMLCEFYEDKVHGALTHPRTIKEIYLWWVDERPKRIDTPLDTSVHVKKRLTLEQKYLKEDIRMMKKLADVHAFMWT